MKKSDLQSFIKENVVEALTESPSNEEIKIAKSAVVRLMKYRNIGIDEAIRDLANALDVLKTQRMSEATIETSPEDLAKVKSSAKDDDIIKVVSEDEDDDVDAKAIKAAKGARGKHKKLDLAVKALKNITTEMKSLARDYSKADGVEKEKIKDKLKLKTPKKKELEALVAKLEKDVV